MGHSAGFHNRLHVREVQVDHRRHRDQVADALDALAQYVVCNTESFQHGGSLVDHLQQPVIRNHNQRVHMLLQLVNAGFGILHALFAFKIEGLGNHRDGQRAQVPRDFRNDRGRAGAGAAAHTGGDEHQVRAFQGGSDFLPAFLRRAAAHLRNRARAQALGQLFADLDLDLCVGLAQRLPVGIHGDEFDTAQTRIHHAVHSVVSAAAAADDLDGSESVLFFVLEFDHVLNLPTDSGKSL